MTRGRMTQGLGLALIGMAMAGCSDRFVSLPGECLQRNPRPLTRLSPREEWLDVVPVQEDVWLVNIARYAVPVLKGREALDYAAFQVIGGRVDRVAGCDPVESVSDTVRRVYRSYPDGPIVGDSIEGADVLFDEDGYPRAWLPGDNGKFIRSLGRDILGADSTGSLYRWNPGEPPETREVLLRDVHGWLVPEMYPPAASPEFAVLRDPDRIVVLDLASLTVSPIAEIVPSNLILVLPGGRYAFDIGLIDGLTQTSYLVDATRQRVVLTAEDVVHWSMIGTTERGLLRLFQSEEPGGCTKTQLISFPNFEVHEEPRCLKTTSELDETGLYLGDDEATYHYELGTKRLTQVFDRVVQIHTRGRWSYLIERNYIQDDRPPRVRLSRIPRLDFDATAEEILDETLVAGPFRLQDGRWLIHRGEARGAPTEMLALDPDTGERSRLSSRVAPWSTREVRRSPLGDEDPSGEIAELHYLEVERDGSSTVWVYRVPEAKE